MRACFSTHVLGFDSLFTFLLNRGTTVYKPFSQALTRHPKCLRGRGKKNKIQAFLNIVSNHRWSNEGSERPNDSPKAIWKNEHLDLWSSESKYRVPSVTLLRFPAPTSTEPAHSRHLGLKAHCAPTPVCKALLCIPGMGEACHPTACSLKWPFVTGREGSEENLRQGPQGAAVLLKVRGL